MDASPVLAARHLSMAYPGVLALGDVDSDVRAGEVHALVGQNGAGKSTLIKILSGELAGYEGQILLMAGRSDSRRPPMACAPASASSRRNCSSSRRCRPPTTSSWVASRAGAWASLMCPI